MADGDEDNSFWGRFCTRTTIHGFSDLYLARGWFAKIFWAVSLLGAITAVIYYNYVMVVQFLSKPSATSISYQDVNMMKFPNITICSNQLFNSTFVKNNIYFTSEQTAMIQSLGYNISYVKSNFVSYLSLPLLNFIPFDPDKDNTLVGILQNIYDKIVKTIDIYDYYYAAGFSCESFLKECIFNGLRFDCCKYARPVITANGVCYHMHYETSQNDGAFQTSVGSDRGFTITTEVNTSCGAQRDIGNRLNYSQDDGIIVHMVDYVSLLDFNPLLIPPKTHATVRMLATQYFVNRDTDNCYDSGQSYQLAYREVYTPNLCRQECASNSSLRNCQCHDPVYYATAPANISCTPLQMLQCVYPLLANKSNNDNMIKTQECVNEKCWQTCEYWLYEPNVMYSEMETAGSNSDSDIVQTKTTIYYGQLQYKTIEMQLLMNTETFVANVGGITGLWIGMSLLSILQFFFILFCGPFEKKQRDKCAVAPEKEPQTEVEEIPAEPQKLPPQPECPIGYPPMPEDGRRPVYIP